MFWHLQCEFPETAVFDGRHFGGFQMACVQTNETRPDFSVQIIITRFPSIARTAGTNRFRELEPLEPEPPRTEPWPSSAF